MDFMRALPLSSKELRLLRLSNEEKLYIFKNHMMGSTWLITLATQLQKIVLSISVFPMHSLTSVLSTIGNIKNTTSIVIRSTLVMIMILYYCFSCLRSDSYSLPDSPNRTMKILRERSRKMLIMKQSITNISIFICRKSLMWSLSQKMFTSSIPTDWLKIRSMQYPLSILMKYIYQRAKRDIQIELVRPLQYSLQIQRKSVCTTKPGMISIRVQVREQSFMLMVLVSSPLILKKYTLIAYRNCEASTKAQKVMSTYIRAMLACCLYFLISLILSKVTTKMTMSTPNSILIMIASVSFLTSQQQNYSLIHQYNCQMDLQNPQHDDSTDVLEAYYDYPDSEMLKLDIKMSNLPGSGMGLFASKPINQNEIIAEYYGSVMRTVNCNDKEFTYEDKMIQVDNQVCVISRGPASRANDTVKWEPQNYNSVLFKMLRQKSDFPRHKEYPINATISLESKQKAFLKATKPIKPGQQIFIEYGFEYWDFFYKLNLGLNTQK